MPSLKLSNKAGLPTVSNYDQGDMVKVNSQLYVLTGGNNNEN